VVHSSSNAGFPVLVCTKHGFVIETTIAVETIGLMKKTARGALQSHPAVVHSSSNAGFPVIVWQKDGFVMDKMIAVNMIGQMKRTAR
jgi:hypothetical protein